MDTSTSRITRLASYRERALRFVGSASINLLEALQPKHFDRLIAKRSRALLL